jgi:hypothetical protein
MIGNALSNYAVNAPVLASRRLQGKRRASRPARYRERWAAPEFRRLDHATRGRSHLYPQ